MTQFSKHEVINNLRRERTKLEDKLTAVTEWFVENGAFHCDVHDLIGLRKILEDGD